MSNRSEEYYRNIINKLVKLPTEEEWFEFKVSNKDPERIAKYISGLSNSATLLNRSHAYIIWGINDDTHEIEGTSFEYHKQKKGNEELESWLTKMVNPNINFKFIELFMTDNNANRVRVTVLEIPCAEDEPTKFKSEAYIRVGSNLFPIVKYKEKEAELWRKFDKRPFEHRFACTEADESLVIQLLDYPAYYKKMGMPIPRNREDVFSDLINEKFIVSNDAGTWDITNFGALMIGTDLKKFENLNRKTIRVIRYKDKSRLAGVEEINFSEGYAIEFEKIINYIMSSVSDVERMEIGITHTFYKFPEIAVRELLANIMVHQDLNQKGTNPMVEIFSDRIEFSNAGQPLVSIKRIIDTVPKSRNEEMAGFLHKCGICEERGSGYDKIIDSIRRNALLAPRIEVQDESFTKVTLFSKIPYETTSRDDRIRTCFMLTSLAFVNTQSIGNTDIRKAFDLNDKEKYKASRIIKDTVEAGLIKPLDENTAPRYMRYVPFWA